MKKRIAKKRGFSESFVPEATSFGEFSKIPEGVALESEEESPEKNLLADDKRSQETVCKSPKKGVSKLWIFYQTKRLT